LAFPGFWLFLASLNSTRLVSDIFAMRPLADLKADEACHLKGLLFDFDDTLLSSGELHEEAYRALFTLQRSGLLLIGLTGRPSSWGQVLAQLWPVRGVISENGAFAHFREGERIRAWDPVSPAVRASRRARLEEIAKQIHMAVPKLPDTDDANGRTTDHTFDIGEFNHASPLEIETASGIATAAGARTTRSSVHLHVTFDAMDKATGAVHFLRRLGYDSTEILRRFAFIGDSENDAPCFAAFRTTIGVKNLRGRFSLLPRYQTSARMGDGFVEATKHLERLRTPL
jgi:HAD superfamily hydrolase (TIGR01484 family)